MNVKEERERKQNVNWVLKIFLSHKKGKEYQSIGNLEYI